MDFGGDFSGGGGPIPKGGCLYGGLFIFILVGALALFLGPSLMEIW